MSEHDSQNKTARTREPEHDSQNMTAKTRRPKHNSQNTIARVQESRSRFWKVFCKILSASKRTFYPGELDEAGSIYGKMAIVYQVQRVLI